MLPRNLLREPGNTIDWIFNISNCSHCCFSNPFAAPGRPRSPKHEELYGEAAARRERHQVRLEMGGWDPTQLYGDYFISQYKDPVMNQSVEWKVIRVLKAAWNWTIPKYGNWALGDISHIFWPFRDGLNIYCYTGMISIYYLHVRILLEEGIVRCTFPRITNCQCSFGVHDGLLLPQERLAQTMLSRQQCEAEEQLRRQWLDRRCDDDCHDQASTGKDSQLLPQKCGTF